jgi:hypothetical protein
MEFRSLIAVVECSIRIDHKSIRQAAHNNGKAARVDEGEGT